MHGRVQNSVKHLSHQFSEIRAITENTLYIGCNYGKIYIGKTWSFIELLFRSNGFPSIGKFRSCLSFHFQIPNRMLHFIAQFMNILVLMGMVFVIISEIFHGRISLNLVLLLLLVNFVSGFRLELMYVSLIKSVRSGLTHLHDSQLLMLLP